MVRKCSHCRNDGHNSRTCNNPKLFGVHLQIYSHISSSSSSSSSTSSSSLVSIDETGEKLCNGYLSHAFVARVHDRKKGVPWSEEEHRCFLIGLERLGKGDWRGISRNFVRTRTPTQVASHAQKYFLRMNSTMNTKRRRTCLFDLVKEGQLLCSEIDLNLPPCSSSKSSSSKALFVETNLELSFSSRYV
ncbi:putative transcription factor MYB-HB-like family [Dioscorea sansibarensis]